MASSALCDRPLSPLPLNNQRHENFCQLYATNMEYLGNGTRAYMVAYDIDINDKRAEKSARVSACNLLKKPSILHRIAALLESGFTDAQADTQLLFLITQFADLRVKIAAIREYNALKGRIRKKMETDFSHLSDSELEAERRLLERDIAEIEAMAC